MEAFVINLDRSPDRWSRVSRMLQTHGIKYTRVSAVDGQQLTPRERKKQTTRLCGAFCTDAQLGCALSHYHVWDQIVKQKSNMAMVFEDDVSLVDGFSTKLNSFLREVPQDFDIVYLGCFIGCFPDGKLNFLDRVLLAVAKISTKPLGKKWVRVSEHVYIPTLALGAHAYIVSRKGAQKLLELTRGIAEGHVDTQIQSYAESLNIYALTPMLAFQNQSQSVSTISISNFPAGPLRVLDQIHLNPTMTAAYAISVPVGRLKTCFGTYMINGWTALFLIAGICGAVFKWNTHKMFLIIITLCARDVFYPKNYISIIMSGLLLALPSFLAHGNVLIK